MSYYTNPGVGNPRFPYKSFFTSIDGNVAPTEYVYNTKTNDLFTMRSFRDVTNEVFADFTALGHGVGAPTTYRWFANYAQTNAKLILSLSAIGDPSNPENVILDLRGTLKTPIIYFREARDYDYYGSTAGRLRFDDTRFLMNFQRYIYIGTNTNPTDNALNNYKLYVDGNERIAQTLFVDNAIGIGTLNPVQALHVEGKGYIRDYLVTPAIRSVSEQITLEMSTLNRTIFTYAGNKNGFFDNVNGNMFVTSNVGYLSEVTVHTYRPDYLLSTVNNNLIMEQYASYVKVNKLFGIGKVPQNGSLDVNGITATDVLRTYVCRSYDNENTYISIGFSNVDVYTNSNPNVLLGASGHNFYYLNQRYLVTNPVGTILRHQNNDKFVVSNFSYFLSNVGIGTPNPGYELDVSGNIHCDKLITDNLTSPNISCVNIYVTNVISPINPDNKITFGLSSVTFNSPTTPILYLSPFSTYFNRNLGIFVTNPEYALDVQGEIRSSNAMICFNFINEATQNVSGLQMDTAGNVFISRLGFNVITLTSTNASFKLGTNLYLLASSGLFGSNTTLYVNNEPIFKCFSGSAYSLKPLAVNKSTITQGYALDVNGDCNIDGNIYVNGTLLRTGTTLKTGNNTTGLFIDTNTGDVTVGWQSTGSKIELLENDIVVTTNDLYTNMEINEAFIKFYIYNNLKFFLGTTTGYFNPLSMGFGGQTNPSYAVDAFGSINASGAMISNQFGSVVRNGGMRINSSNNVEIYREGSSGLTLFASTCQVNRGAFYLVAPSGSSPNMSLYVGSSFYSTFLSATGLNEVYHLMNTDGDVSWYGSAANAVSLRGLLDFQGNWYGTAFQILSDRRFKENIVSLDDDTSKDIINRINPVRYNLKKSGEEQFGFIAQEVEEVCPMMVKVGKGSIDLDDTCHVMMDGDRYYMHRCQSMSEYVLGNRVSIKGIGKIEIEEVVDEKVYLKRDEEEKLKEGEIEVNGVEISDMKSINYTNMIPVLVSAVQSLTAQVESLTARLSALENMSSN